MFSRKENPTFRLDQISVECLVFPRREPAKCPLTVRVVVPTPAHDPIDHPCLEDLGMHPRNVMDHEIRTFVVDSAASLRAGWPQV